MRHTEIVVIAVRNITKAVTVAIWTLWLITAIPSMYTIYLSTEVL